uniref:ATP synthase F0 subunit 8 n=1 Tax=Haustorioides koreanus TaxID=2729224 RepID=A0A6M3RXR4_9CRUS|nr:ATP synthase F0 subunit 8 [Haustorioides koreanus]
MPQMAPLMWLSLYFYFIFMFLLVLSAIFFQSDYKPFKEADLSVEKSKNFFWLW